MVTLEDLRKCLREFARERDWEQFHSPKNLSMALIVEAAELVGGSSWRRGGLSCTSGGRMTRTGPGEMAEVVEFPEGRPLEGVQRLLYTVLEWTGHAGSKHDRERIYIDIRAGQDYVEEYWVGKVQFLVDHLGGLEGNTEFTFPDGETWKVSKKK